MYTIHLLVEYKTKRKKESLKKTSSKANEKQSHSVFNKTSTTRHQMSSESIINYSTSRMEDYSQVRVYYIQGFFFFFFVSK